jgi:hypothetical protein
MAGNSKHNERRNVSYCFIRERGANKEACLIDTRKIPMMKTCLYPLALELPGDLLASRNIHTPPSVFSIAS